MRPYSMDLRERVLAAAQGGELSLRKIARVFSVSLSFLVRLLQRYRATGSLRPRPYPGAASKLNAADEDRLRELVRDQPDSTLAELRDRLGIACSIMAIARALRRLRITRKKKTLHAQQRDSPRVQAQRRDFREKVASLDVNHLVFVDESGATTAMTRAYGRAPRGERVHGTTPGAWKNVTLLVGLRLSGVVAPMVLPGTVDRRVFATYVEEVLIPSLHAGDVVVWDHLSAHQDVGLRKAIESAGAQVETLPVYSPDLSPIEEMFSKTKGFLRKVAARTTAAVEHALGDALRVVTPTDIRGWFQDRCAFAMSA